MEHSSLPQTGESASELASSHTDGSNVTGGDMTDSGLSGGIDRSVLLGCLEEISEHLETIEETLLLLSDGGVEAKAMEGSLRAAHTIKGLSAIAQCPELGVIAHRLEDYLKILSIRQSFVLIDADLQTQLLQIVDRLRQVVEFCQQQQGVSSTWIAYEVDPIFERIHKHLGSLTQQDEANLIKQQAAQHSETDVVAMLFASEVDGLLDRLDTVLANPELPCLREELDLIAQELIDLGQMLDLQAFESLCQSIHHQLKQAGDEGVEAISQQAVQVWRYTQTLVASGELEKIPTALTVEGSATVGDGAIVEDDTDFFTLSDQELGDLQASVFNFDNEDFDNEQPDEQIEPVEIEPLKIQVNSEPQANSSSQVNSSFQANPASDTPAGALVVSSLAEEESTVRIPTKLLASLNDLFGDLIIQRNTLATKLSLLEGLADSTERSAKTLEVMTSELHKLDEQAIIQSAHASGNKAPVNTISSPQAARPAETSSSRFEQTLSLLTQPLPRSDYAELFDPLELDRYGSLSLVAQSQSDAVAELTETADQFRHLLKETKEVSTDLERTTKALQAKLTRATMRPFADAVKPFPRMVRDLSTRYSKPVDFQVKGKLTPVDRHVLDALGNPLMHLIRNAFAHGIETTEERLAADKPANGQIQVSAAQQGNKTVITVEDDGRGISLEKIRDRALKLGFSADELNAATEKELLNFIFEPGFSTTQSVNALSGRGFGMDVVRTDLKQIRGSITVDTHPGVGTKFVLRVPFMLSTIRAMLVEVGGIRLGFPIDSIQEVIRLKSQTTYQEAGQDYLKWAGTDVPVLRLDRTLLFNTNASVTYQDNQPIIDEPIALLTQNKEALQGIYIDKFWGEREIVIRQVEEVLPLPTGFIGCTILGDGHAVPIADTSVLVDWAMAKPLLRRIAQQNQQQSTLQSPSQPFNSGLPSQNGRIEAAASHTPTVLVVDDSTNIRRFVALTLEKAGYQVEQAKDGQDAVEKVLSGLEIDAVLCDVEMPRLDGYGFLSQVRNYQKFEALPVIMLTSRAGDKHRQLANSLGASGYLTKPYDDTELLNTLSNAIEQASHGQA